MNLVLFHLGFICSVFDHWLPHLAIVVPGYAPIVSILCSLSQIWIFQTKAYASVFLFFSSIIFVLACFVRMFFVFVNFLCGWINSSCALCFWWELPLSVFLIRHGYKTQIGPAGLTGKLKRLESRVMMLKKFKMNDNDGVVDYNQMLWCLLTEIIATFTCSCEKKRKQYQEWELLSWEVHKSNIGFIYGHTSCSPSSMLVIEFKG